MASSSRVLEFLAHKEHRVRVSAEAAYLVKHRNLPVQACSELNHNSNSSNLEQGYSAARLSSNSNSWAAEVASSEPSNNQASSLHLEPLVHNRRHPEVLEEAYLVHRRNQPVDCLEPSSLDSNNQVLAAPVCSELSNSSSNQLVELDSSSSSQLPNL